MPSAAATVREFHVNDAAAWRTALLASAEPLLLRGLVRHWPLVQAGTRSAAAALAYLRGFYRNATVGAWYGAPQIRGRFFYNEDCSGFNFRAAMVKLDTVFDELERHLADAEPPAVYVGSTTLDTCLPGPVSYTHLTLPTIYSV